jgi:hypothetical protein
VPEPRGSLKQCRAAIPELLLYTNVRADKLGRRVRACRGMTESDVSDDNVRTVGGAKDSYMRGLDLSSQRK